MNLIWYVKICSNFYYNSFLLQIKGMGVPWGTHDFFNLEAKCFIEVVLFSLSSHHRDHLELVGRFPSVADSNALPNDTPAWLPIDPTSPPTWYTGVEEHILENRYIKFLIGYTCLNWICCFSNWIEQIYDEIEWNWMESLNIFILRFRHWINIICRIPIWHVLHFMTHSK